MRRSERLKQKVEIVDEDAEEDDDMNKYAMALQAEMTAAGLLDELDE